jgi:hypothetical protein
MQVYVLHVFKAGRRAVGRPGHARPDREIQRPRTSRFAAIEDELALEGPRLNASGLGKPPP